MDVAAALAIGFAAGLVAGMLGVGGGILFVPALTLALGMGHLEAISTSLVAIVPVAAVGAWRQHGYGNVRLGEALLLGVLACGGAVVGVAIANVVDEDVLRVLFAVLMLVTAAQLAQRSARRPPEA